MCKKVEATMSSSRKESERAKFVQEKCQTLLTVMLRDEDNKYCVDCDAKGKTNKADICMQLFKQIRLSNTAQNRLIAKYTHFSTDNTRRHSISSFSSVIK